MAEAKHPESAQVPSKPIKVFRGPGGISVSVWENKLERNGKTIVYHRATLQKVFKFDGFKKSGGFNRDDLPVASHLLQQAWEFILEEEAKARKGGEGGK